MRVHVLEDRYSVLFLFAHFGFVCFFLATLDAFLFYASFGTIEPQWLSFPILVFKYLFPFKINNYASAVRGYSYKESPCPSVGLFFKHINIYKGIQLIFELLGDEKKLLFVNFYSNI